jgi:hypothetical protein
MDALRELLDRTWVKVVLVVTLGYWSYQYFYIDRPQAKAVAAAKAKAKQRKGQPNEVVMYSLSN